MSPRPETPPAPPPLESDDARTVLVITLAWVLAMVVLLVLAVTGMTEVRGWWLGMCGYGIALGAFGVWHLRRRKALAREQP
ncbi:MAG: hypothetical protein JWN88_1566 [Frankiales bacterium]|jgi:hypothetical protein|nr:hypothetical protein [Frankiales bacterium]